MFRILQPSSHMHAVSTGSFKSIAFEGLLNGFSLRTYSHMFCIPQPSSHTHAVGLSLMQLSELALKDLCYPNRTKQLSTVALFTNIVWTRVKSVARMCVGSDQSLELSFSQLILSPHALPEVCFAYPNRAPISIII